MRWLGYGSLAIAAYALFMITLFPVATLIARLDEARPNLRIASASGTAFSGSANDVNYNGSMFERLSWRWQPAALLQGRIGFRLQASGSDLNLHADASVGIERELRVSGLRGHLPLPRAIALSGRPPPPISGMLELDLQQVRVSVAGSPRSVAGIVRLNNLHTAFGRTLTLGDFRTEFHHRNDSIGADINDTGGPVKLDGSLTLTPNGDYRVSAHLGLRRSAEPELAQALGLLGPPAPDGRWHFEVSGVLML